MSSAFPATLERFATHYAEHRASEGRGHSGPELLSLPYLRTGPLARQWAVRARSFDALVKHVVRPLARSAARPLRILDLGAGNGWLSYRLALEGHDCAAVDIRDDAVDGLGAAAELCRKCRFDCVRAPFEALPLPDRSADLAVFNASLHYAVDLSAALAEAVRTVRRGGRIVILDSPFYRRDADGRAMVLEKQAHAESVFAERAEPLLALPFIEYLTRERLAEASPSLAWRRRRIGYPLWYELRPLLAWWRGARRPSRFDLWIAEVP